MSKPRVLFLCTGNSARSQMAEGSLRRIAGEQFEALSADTNPAGVNPLAIAAMQEMGIDISAQRSKHIAEFLGQPIDYVITVCDRAKESCPIFPGTPTTMSWSLDDPTAATGTEDQKLEAFRRIRNQILQKIENEFLPMARANA